MSDRLAEIETWVAHPSPEPWDRGQVYADLRDLLAVAKAAQEFIEEYRAMNGGEEPGDGPTRRLAWALANLEGGAS